MTCPLLKSMYIEHRSERERIYDSLCHLSQVLINFDYHPFGFSSFTHNIFEMDDFQNAKIIKTEQERRDYVAAMQGLGKLLKPENLFNSDTFSGFTLKQLRETVEEEVDKYVKNRPSLQVGFFEKLCHLLKSIFKCNYTPTRDYAGLSDIHRQTHSNRLFKTYVQFNAKSLIETQQRVMYRHSMVLG